MERNLLKGLKNEMDILRLLPIVLAIIQFINIITLFLGVDYRFLQLLGSVSIIPLIFFYISSHLFHFCYYHRISLYYLAITKILLIFDEYIGLPIDYFTLLIIHIGLFFWLILSLIYFKLK